MQFSQFLFLLKYENFLLHFSHTSELEMLLLIWILPELHMEKSTTNFKNIDRWMDKGWIDISIYLYLLISMYISIDVYIYLYIHIYV